MHQIEEPTGIGQEESEDHGGRSVLAVLFENKTWQQDNRQEGDESCKKR